MTGCRRDPSFKAHHDLPDGSHAMLAYALEHGAADDFV